MNSLIAYKTLGPYIGRRFKEVNTSSLVQLAQTVYPILGDSDLSIKSLRVCVSDINNGRGYRFLPHNLKTRRNEEYINQIWVKRIDRLAIILYSAGFKQDDKLHDALRINYDDYDFPPTEKRRIIVPKPKIIKKETPIKLEPQEMVFKRI